MLVKGQNHCCCKPPKQCEQEVQFNPYNFDEMEKPGTTTVFDIYYDNSTSSVTLTGEGSLTTRVTDNPKTIFVHAHILDLNAGSGGITIRRIDSNDSVSLWYLGGTSYELRQGTTVLESITSTSGGEIKLELATPREPTTDVLVYIDGVLEHTETGVSFTMPDVLHLGMVTEGASGGDIRFGYLAVSPCPACTPLTIECHGGKPMPAAWKLAVSGLSGEEDVIQSSNGILSCEDPEAPQVIEYCDLFNGDYFLVPRSHTLTNSSGGYCNDPISNAWGEPPEGWPGCEYISAFPMPNVPGYSTPVPEGFVAGLIKYYCTVRGSTIDHLCYYPADRSMGMIPGMSGILVDATPAVTLGVFHSIPNSTMTFKAILHYGYREDFDPGEGLHAEYESDEISDTTDFLTTGITLNKVSSYGCTDMPNTLFIDPDSEEARGLVQQLSSCGTACTPPVTPQPGFEYFIWISFEDEDGDFWDYPVCLGVDYNDTTGSWEWAGLSDGGDTHPTCGTLPSIEVKIHCVEPDEGESKQWVMDITSSLGTARLLQVEDPEMGNIFEGTSDYMCSGQTWDVATLPLTVVDDLSPQFGNCDQSSCGALWLIGQATIGCNDSSYSQANFYLNRAAKGNSGSPPSEWAIPGVDPSSIYGSDVYTGTWPFGSGYTLYVWAIDGSTYSWKVSHSSGTNIAMSSGNITCVGGEFGLDYTSSPYDWFGLPGGDPFGVCPGLDDSANIDIVWG